MTFRAEEFVWLSPSEFAAEYKRTPRMIQMWCASGFIIELGYTIRREANGYWQIGVPVTAYQCFASASNRETPNP